MHYNFRTEFWVHPARKDPDLWNKLKSDRSLQQTDISLCKANFWHFFGHCKTNDADKALIESENSIAYFPDYLYLNPQESYLALAADYLLNERFLVIIKSRQIMISWLIAAIALWECLFRNGYWGYYRLYKEKKSNQFIKERIYPMFKNLPHWIQSAFIINPGTQGKHKYSIFENTSMSSRILGIGKGSQQLRGENASRHINDDAQESEALKEDFTSYRPIIGKSGGFDCMVGTARSKNEFWASVAERPIDFNQITEIFPEVMTWKNETGYTVLEIPYRADPLKNSKTEEGRQWIEKTRATMDEDTWQREYEINWDYSSEGLLFPEFNDYMNLICQPCKFDSTIPLICGWDFGFSPGASVCIVSQIQCWGIKDFSLNILKTYIRNNMFSTEFIPWVLDDRQSLYPTRRVFEFIDIDGTKHDRRGKSEYKILLDEKQKMFLRGDILYRKMDNKDKPPLLHYVLRKRPDGNSCYLRIDPDDPGNKLLILALSKKIYSKGDGGLEAKNPWKDLLDAISYLLVQLFNYKGEVHDQYTNKHLSGINRERAFFRRG